MRHGAVRLRLSGPGGERTVTFSAQTGCPSIVELVTGPELNAWADGVRVMVSEGLVRRSASDDDLALVIGHEMAHNLLHHRQRLAAEGVLASRLLPLTEAGTAAMRETEEEADALAVRLAANASYDLSGAVSFLGGLMDGRGAVAATHPDPDRRLALLRAAIANVRDRNHIPQRVSE
jgi:predicted Zn-dependent protease